MQEKVKNTLSSKKVKTEEIVRVSTGVTGLDDIMRGGFLSGNTYLLRGGPGSGKTTLGLQFLHAGAVKGEKTLCISLIESEARMRKNAEALHLGLDDTTFLDLSPSSEFFTQMESYDIFSPAEVEREPITQKIIEQVEQVNPQRVFLDSITQFRLLSTDTFQFRKQALSFLRFLVDHGATVIFTSEASTLAPDDDLQFMCDGVIELTFVSNKRYVNVAKLRGSDFSSGPHSMRLTAQGMVVYPHLIPEVHKREFVVETISSGIPELDELLHGGLERGTISVITGPSGVGKTTLGLQFMKEAAGRGERSVIYLFDELPDTLIRRAEAVNIPVGAMLKRGTLSITHVEPLRFTPDEFAYLVRHEIEQQENSFVMIDSVAGYRLSVHSNDLVSHLHALSKYLQNMGIAVLLLNEVESITGEFRATEMNISYMADNIIFMRYLEIDGELHKSIGVLKKRLTDFEKTLRALWHQIGCPIVWNAWYSKRYTGVE
jgi:circadian clock protein KaiC